jgi:hypothetical protein
VEKLQDLLCFLTGLCKTKLKKVTSAAGIQAQVLGCIFPKNFLDLDEVFVYVRDKGLEDANNYFLMIRIL